MFARTQNELESALCESGKEPLGPCLALTKKGAKCPWPAQFADGKCFFHSETPEAEALRRERRRRGGLNSHRASGVEKLPSLQSPTAILGECERLLGLLLAGEISPRAAQAARGLLQEARESYQLIVLEQRLREALKKLEAPPLLVGARIGEDEDGTTQESN